MVPPPAVNLALKNLDRPALYDEVRQEKTATFFMLSLVAANLAIAPPWNGSMKQTRKT